MSSFACAVDLIVVRPLLQSIRCSGTSKDLPVLCANAGRYYFDPIMRQLHTDLFFASVDQDCGPFDSSASLVGVAGPMRCFEG